MLIGKNIPIKYILKAIKLDIAVTSLFVLVIMIGFKLIGIKVDLPINVPAFLGTAITLILSFKLNQSYDRWWEARKVWGAIVNDSRTLIFQFKNFNSNNFSKQDLKKVVNRQAAWCFELTYSLRNINRERLLENYLNKEEFDSVKNSNNIPMAILNQHHKQISELEKSNGISGFQFLSLENTIQRLTTSMGQAERIKKTVFPITYRIQLHTLIYLFLLTLTISLQTLTWYYEAIIIIAVAIPFFLLENTAFLLQDPFENRPTDTPITTISETIEKNMNSLINEEPVEFINKTKKQDYYVL